MSNEELLKSLKITKEYFKSKPQSNYTFDMIDILQEEIKKLQNEQLLSKDQQ